MLKLLKDLFHMQPLHAIQVCWTLGLLNSFGASDKQFLRCYAGRFEQNLHKVMNPLEYALWPKPGSLSANPCVPVFNSSMWAGDVFLRRGCKLISSKTKNKTGKFGKSTREASCHPKMDRIYRKTKRAAESKPNTCGLTTGLRSNSRVPQSNHCLASGWEERPNFWPIFRWLQLQFLRRPENGTWNTWTRMLKIWFRKPKEYPNSNDMMVRFLRTGFVWVRHANNSCNFDPTRRLGDKCIGGTLQRTLWSNSHLGDKSKE